MYLHLHVGSTTESDVNGNSLASASSSSVCSARNRTELPVAAKSSALCSNTGMDSSIRISDQDDTALQQSSAPAEPCSGIISNVDDPNPNSSDQMHVVQLSLQLETNGMSSESDQPGDRAQQTTPIVPIHSSVSAAAVLDIVQNQGLLPTESETSGAVGKSAATGSQCVVDGVGVVEVIPDVVIETEVVLGDQ